MNKEMEQKLLDIAARNLLLSIYKFPVDSDNTKNNPSELLSNIYHESHTDGLSCSNFYDLYQTIIQSNNPSLYWIVDGEFLKIGNDDYLIPMRDFQCNSDIEMMKTYFNVIEKSMEQLLNL